MPDLSAGTTVKALDTPVTVEVENSTAEVNIASTAYTAGTNVCSTTFVGATTGRAMVHLHSRLNGDGTNRLWVSFEVRQGTDATGALVVGASDNNAVCTKSSGLEESQATAKLLSGLTPSATYFIRTMHRVSAGNTADIPYRRLIVAPTT